MYMCYFITLECVKEAIKEATVLTYALILQIWPVKW